MPVIDAVLEGQIDAPHVPSLLQQRTAAEPVSSSVHSTVSAPPLQASTVSANGCRGVSGGVEGGGGVGGGGEGGGVVGGGGDGGGIRGGGGDGGGICGGGGDGGGGDGGTGGGGGIGVSCAITWYTSQPPGLQLLSCVVPHSPSPSQ